MKGGLLVIECPWCGAHVSVPNAVGEIVCEDERQNGIKEQTLTATCEKGHRFEYTRFVAPPLVFQEGE